MYGLDSNYSEITISIGRWENEEFVNDDYKVANLSQDVIEILDDLSPYNYLKIAKLGLLLIKEIWYYDDGMGIQIYCRKVSPI